MCVFQLRYVTIGDLSTRDHPRTACQSMYPHQELALKMIGKGFVFFKVNSSPSAFYITKPTCMTKRANPIVCLCWLVMTSSPSESKHPPCLYSGTALNLIYGMLSAQFKFNNNVERWNWQSWFIYGRITAAAGPRSVNTAGAAGKSHF